MLASTLVSSAALLLAATNGSREGALNRFRQGHAHVRYSYGSCDSSSMDCSCFIQNLYLQVFRQQIPRTTLTQEQWLRPHRVSDIKLPRDLSENSLCPGDLIYTFQGKSWQEGPRHVAVYQGGGRILH